MLSEDRYVNMHTPHPNQGSHGQNMPSWPDACGVHVCTDPGALQSLERSLSDSGATTGEALLQRMHLGHILSTTKPGHQAGCVMKAAELVKLWAIFGVNRGS